MCAVRWKWGACAQLLSTCGQPCFWGPEGREPNTCKQLCDIPAVLLRALVTHCCSLHHGPLITLVPSGWCCHPKSAKSCQSSDGNESLGIKRWLVVVLSLAKKLHTSQGHSRWTSSLQGSAKLFARHVQKWVFIEKCIKISLIKPVQSSDAFSCKGPDTAVKELCSCWYCLTSCF